jgi:HD superfamily phosphohydrolase
MDRLDYLQRDSFFTGVTEGNIGSARIIKMLNVKDDRLVVDSKGIYSIENFLTTRRLMYWQVYLHRTAVGYEKILVNTLLRAKYLTKIGYSIFATPALAYFLRNEVDAEWFSIHEETLQMFADLDDSDIWSAMKVWKNSDDIILSTLATDMLNRHLFKVEISEEAPSEEYLTNIRKQIARQMNISYEDSHYLVTLTEIGKDMYNPEDDSIGILYNDGTVKDIAKASEILNVQLLSKKIRKYYLCYHRF